MQLGKNQSHSLQDNQSFQKVPKKNYPGPGAYEIPSNFKDKRILYESDDAQLKIIHEGPSSAAFRSECHRFQPPPFKKAPGPGSYDIRENHVYPNYNTDRKQTYRPKLIEMLMFAGQYQQVNSIPYQKRVEVGVGPGQYRQEGLYDCIVKHSKGSLWTKQSSKSSLVINQDSQLGPGQYDVDQFYNRKINRRRQLSQHVSALPKHYIKKGLNNRIYYSFHKEGDDDENHSEYEYIDDSTPGPGYYHAEQSTQSTFANRNVKQKLPPLAPRFKDRVQDLGPGPGEYEVKLPGPSAINIEFGKEERFLKLVSQADSPGPGHYSPKNELKDRLVQNMQKSPMGDFGTKQQRFPSPVSNSPPPGKYNVEEKPRGRPSPTNQFKSTSNRELYSGVGLLTPSPGSYDLTKDSIAVRLQKELTEQKELEVIKPPFGVKDERWRKPNEKDKLNESYQERQPNLRFKPVAKPSPGFQSSQRRFTELIENLTPSPWDYDTDRKWTKRSFNYMYAVQR